MTASPRNAVLFGATGLVGHALLDLALADARVARLTAPTRRPLGIAHAKLENPVGDIAAGVPAGTDVAFCCLGTTLKQAGGREGFRAVDHDLVLACARAARQAGVPHFMVVSAMGASAASPVFYNRVKAETEHDLASLAFPQLTIIQPSLLLGERGGQARPGEAIGAALAPLFGPLMAGPLSPYKPVAGRDVAAAMLARAFVPTGMQPVERLRWRELMQLAGKA